MGRFNSDRNSGRRGRRSDGPTTMYDAVCDECGKDCKVPFSPSGDKPIYCSDCFEKHDPKKDGRRDFGGRDDRRSSGRRDDRRGSGRSGSFEMFDAVCDDCGKDCQVPFRPTTGKDIFCSDCFEKRGNSHEGSRARSRMGNDSQLEAINEKLDRILEALKK